MVMIKTTILGKIHLWILPKMEGPDNLILSLAFLIKKAALKKSQEG